MQEPLPLYAHSLSHAPPQSWELLATHAKAVARAAETRAMAFGWGPVGNAMGLLHDIGKASQEFQKYLIGSRDAGGKVDHSTAGARAAQRIYAGPAGRLLAFGIAGHHAGLADGEDLVRRLDPKRTPIPDHSRWSDLVHAPDPGCIALCRKFDTGGPPGFALAFLIRMLFSCLVDADFVETERFYAADEGRLLERGDFASITALAERLDVHLARLRREDTAVNRLRAHVLDHAVAKAALPTGLFTMTVPTGGGKTLTSLAWAMKHACHHDLRRVVYVVPYTSIIEQTAAVFQDALGSSADVLEHHSSFDWEEARHAASAAEADAGEGCDGLGKLRRAAENWDAPVIVTTAVQFFESLFANRASRCRKLHNLAKSVIVLDEAQTLPLPLLHPCLAALDQLARNYGTSVLLCTATQPALRKQDGFRAGLDIPDDRELAPDPGQLYQRLRRVRVERRPGLTDDAIIAERFEQSSQMLCIVNSRAHARDLFERVRALDGALHLSTLMCPRHRRAVLARIRSDLIAGKPVRLVATSLIEAGVDIDFPEVWRAASGLDQVAQAAGRCNREGKRTTPGRVVVFDPANHKPPHALRAAQGEAESVFRRHADDPLSLAAIRDYFQQYYWAKGEQAFDSAKLDGRPYRILPALEERGNTLDFPFATIARAFRVIDEAMEPVIVPWQASPDDTASRDLLARIAAMDRPLRDDLRSLQQYVVPVPAKMRADWLAQSVLRPLHRAMGKSLLVFPDLAHYDDAIGLQVEEPHWRAVENNIL